MPRRIGTFQWLLYRGTFVRRSRRLPFPSVEWFEFLALSFFSDWNSVSNCVATGAKIAFIFMSISLGDIVRPRNWDCKLSSPSLVDSPEWWTSPTSTNCLVGVIFSSGKLFMSWMARKWRFILYLIEYDRNNQMFIKQKYAFTESNLWEQWFTYWYCNRVKCKL